MSDVVKDGETWKLPDGTIVRRRTKRLGLVIARQRYTYKGEVRFANNFHLEVMVNRETAHFPLGTDATEAAKKADEIGAYLALPTNTLEMARREYDPRAIARKEKFATLGEVFAAHEKGARTLGISPTTGKGYRYSLVHIIRHVEAARRGREVELQSGKRLDLSPWMGLPTTILTAKQLLDFKSALMPKLMKVDGLKVEPDEEEILTAQISTDSLMRQARSLFSEDARRYYRHLRLPLPDLKEWMEVPMFGARKYFELQPVTVIRAVFEGAEDLRKADLNCWRALILCLHIGLRKAEAAAMRWDWVEVIDEKPMVCLREDGMFRPKAGTGRRVPFKPWVWKLLTSERELTETIITGKDTERTENVFSRLNAWLKERGVDSQKPVHELRKLFISYVSKTEGLLAAQKAAGHRDPKTTSTCYADPLLATELLAYWQQKTG